MNLKAIMAHLDSVDRTDGAWHSYPLPFVDKTLKLRAYFCIARFDGKPGLVFSPVTRLVEIDAATNEIVSNQEVGPATPLGRSVFDIPRDELAGLEERLGGAYAALVPSFSRGDGKPAAGLESQAKLFAEIFPRVQGEAFMPVSWQYGEAWLSWLGMPKPK